MDELCGIIQVNLKPNYILEFIKVPLKYKKMIAKLLMPALSKREKLIIKECCQQVFKSMHKQNIDVGLPTNTLQIMEDIAIIIKKLDHIK